MVLLDNLLHQETTTTMDHHLLLRTSITLEEDQDLQSPLLDPMKTTVNLITKIAMKTTMTTEEEDTKVGMTTHLLLLPEETDLMDHTEGLKMNGMDTLTKQMTTEDTKLLRDHENLRDLKEQTRDTELDNRLMTETGMQTITEDLETTSVLSMMMSDSGEDNKDLHLCRLQEGSMPLREITTTETTGEVTEILIPTEVLLMHITL